MTPAHPDPPRRIIVCGTTAADEAGPVLARHGYAWDLCHDGAALRAAAAAGAGAAVLDDRCLRRVLDEGFADAPRPPLVVLTDARAQAEAWRRAVELADGGAVSILPRPVGDEPLLAAVRIALHHHRRRARLEEAVAFQRLLLREAHHRIKNDMQMLSCVLNIGRNAVSAEAQSLFDEALSRINAMALAHEILHVGEGDTVNLADLLDALCRSLAPGAAAPRIRVRAEPVDLPRTDAVPFAMLVNEAVMNALKHAAGARHVWVSLQSRDGAALLRVRDDGPGLPDSLDTEHAPSFGMRLMAGLSRQLGGECRFAGGRGTTFELRLPLTRD